MIRMRSDVRRVCRFSFIRAINTLTAAYDTPPGEVRRGFQGSLFFPADLIRAFRIDAPPH